MVKEYFGEGSRWGVDIRYIEEKTRLGTAGALGLLSEIPILPLLVMNADVLTKVNFKHLLEFHDHHKSVATMCVPGIGKLFDSRVLVSEGATAYIMPKERSLDIDVEMDLAVAECLLRVPADVSMVSK